MMFILHTVIGKFNSKLTPWLQLLSASISVDRTKISSYVTLRVISVMISLRVDQQDEINGLDLSQHDERGYHSN